MQGEIKKKKFDTGVGWLVGFGARNRGVGHGQPKWVRNRLQLPDTILDTYQRAVGIENGPQAKVGMACCQVGGRSAGGAAALLTHAAGREPCALLRALNCGPLAGGLAPPRCLCVGGVTT